MRQTRVFLIVGAVIMIALALVAGRSVLAACSVACGEGSCWKSADQCTEYDRTTAKDDYYVNGGAGVLKSGSNILKERTASTCTKECAGNTNSRASACGGTTGEWESAGTTDYCGEKT